MSRDFACGGYDVVEVASDRDDGEHVCDLAGDQPDVHGDRGGGETQRG